jgi:hypothetical protein
MPYRCPRPNRAGRDSTDTWLLAFYESSVSAGFCEYTSKTFQSYFVVEKKGRTQSGAEDSADTIGRELDIEGTMNFDLVITGGVIVRVLYSIPISTCAHNSNIHTGHSQRSSA